MEDSVPIRESYNFFNEKGIYFSIDYPSFMDETKLLIRWNLLEALGWDAVYIEDITGGISTPANLFLGETEVFKEGNVRGYLSLNAFLSAYMEIAENQLTDEMLNLSAYGLDFLHDEITLEYLAQVRAEQLLLAESGEFFDGIDFLGENVRDELYGFIDSDLTDYIK